MLLWIEQANTAITTKSAMPQINMDLPVASKEPAAAALPVELVLLLGKRPSCAPAGAKHNDIPAKRANSHFRIVNSQILNLIYGILWVF